MTESLSGHPAEGADIVSPETTPETTSEKTGNKITIGEKEFMVSDEMAAAYALQAQQNVQLKANNDQIRTDMGVLKTSLEDLKPKPTEPEPTDDFWADPQASVKVQIDDAISAVRDQMMGDQQKKTDIVSFWDEFYKENEDLKKYERIVDATMGTITNLGQMSVEDAKKTIADTTRKYVASIMPKNETDSPLVESPTNHDSAPPADDTAKILSMGDIIRQKNVARRKARTAKL